MFEKKRGTRFLASVMALVMLLSLAPVGALAAGDEPPTNEECSAVALPANEDNPKPVVTDEENTENTNEELIPPPRNEGDTGTPADNNDTSTAISEAVILLEGDLFDQPFGVNPPESSEPSTQYERLYVTILNGTEFPNEPGFSHKYGYDFVKRNDDGGYSIEAYNQASYSSNQQVFSTQAGNFIKVNAFDAAGLTTNGNVKGLYNANGIDLTEYTTFTESDANAIAAAYASYKNLDASATYKLVPYVLKYEDHGKGSDAPSTGYHLDCIVVKNETVLVKYDVNGATTDFQLPDNTYVVPESDVTIGSWKNSSGTTVADNSITAQKNEKDVTFVGWSTNPNENPNSEGLYQANSKLQNVTKETTLYAIWKVKEDTSQPDPPPASPTLVTAKFFINLGGKDASNPNGIGTFTDKIEIPNALNKTTFEDHLDNSMGSNRGFIFNIEGVKKVQGCEDNKLLITEPDIDTINQRITDKDKNDMTVGGNTGREVVWYHVSHCGDGYHVDGYVKGVPITLTYHENFGTSNAQTVIDKNSSGATLNSGDKVTIQSYKQVFTGEATKHEGWTFAGWFTAKGQEYKQEETTLIDSVDLYAKWKKTYTVNFIGNGGVWDSSVSGYTMSTDENSKNIKATQTITVTPTTESTATVSKIATNPTKDKYDFLGWSKTIGGPIITENEWATMKPGETTTIDFYANWKAKQDPTPDTVNYTINKHFKDNKGTTIKDVSGTLTPGTKNVTLGSLINNDAVNQTDENGNNYVYVLGETTFKMGGQTVTSNTQLTSEAIIDLYYYLDNWKDGSSVEEDNEKGGDGIPDCDQVLIKYVSSNSDRGTVSPDMEVLTIKDATTGNPINKGTVKASGSTATATGSSRNYFSNWTNNAGLATSSTAKLGQQTFTTEGGETYTFTANFGYSGGGGSGGSSRPSTPPTVDIPDDVPTGLNGKDHYAYIIGYGNNDVRPQNNITRAEVATIFFRLLTDETRTANMTKSNSYNDVKDGDWFCCAVSTLSKMGIIKGYEDGSFKPNDPISRAEFAAIAARFAPDGDKTPASFFDVTSHWAKDEISIAANHGWIKGYEDGSFKPDQKITRAETMTLVNRVLNRLPETKDDLHKDMKTWVDNMDETAWYYLAVQEATNSHYFKNKTGTKFEQWTDLRDTRDWSELEK